VTKEVSMVVYDADPRVARWFEVALGAGNPKIRCRAVELLASVDCPGRDRWLERASHDDDARVRAVVEFVRAAGAAAVEIPGQDLYESDFADGLGEDDLDWEWEYRFKPCIGLHIPLGSVLVWTKREDDTSARGIAAMKASAGGGAREDVVPVMVGKRLVNRYTRSARSATEATKWGRYGRPRYGGAL
jgi:hypothetical protein